MSVNVYDPINDKLIPVAGATLYADTPIGAIQAFDSTDIPSSFLEFKGQTVNRADYPDLWAHIVKNSLFGVDKFYGVGDGATTFTLADLRETSLKGYGETSRSVGAHVKSGGLGIGEFIDDQLQSHTHGINFESSNPGSKYGINWVAGVAENYDLTVLATNTGREGLTTEVKAVGVVWAVKAKQTGLPIDLKAEMLKVINEKIDSITQGTVTAVSSKISQLRRAYVLYKNGIGYLTVEFDLSSATVENEVLFTLDKSAYVPQLFAVATGYISGTSSGVLRVEGNNVMCDATLPAGIVWGGGCSFIVSP